MENFLRDSLALIQRCDADCSRSTWGAPAERAWRFALPATPPKGAATPSDPALQRRFDALVASSFDRLSRPTAPEIAAIRTITTPARVRIQPTVVVPLPHEVLAAAAPVPAARLDRSAGNMMASIAPGEPVEERAPSTLDLPSAPPSRIVGQNAGVAIYDISAAVVYMPDGERLEAHSGLGHMVDNPHFVDRRNTGPTPPNTYDLVMRKGRFHGVEALRLIPANGDNKFGRVGLLAHTYLLRGRPAESNGCVAFKNYPRFLEAFKRGSVKRLVVVPSLAGSSTRVASQ